jgi:hypothetical protein
LQFLVNSWSEAFDAFAVPSSYRTCVERGEAKS